MLSGEEESVDPLVTHEPFTLRTLNIVGFRTFNVSKMLKLIKSRSFDNHDSHSVTKYFSQLLKKYNQNHPTSNAS